MKVWTFYARPSDVFLNTNDVTEMTSVYGEDTDILYAMTRNKEDAKTFKRVRNMDIFREVVLDLTDSEWEILAHDNRDCYLEYKKVLTRQQPEDKSYPEECTAVKILMTLAESIDIDDNTYVENIIFTNFAEYLSPVGILCIPLLKKLFKLHYWDMINIAKSEDYDIDISMCPVTELDNQMIELRNEFNYTIEVDELEYFIDHYGHTLATK